MDALARAAEEILTAHPHPALRLGELLDLVAERMDRGLRHDRLRCALEAEPTRFRLIESWRTRWPTLAREAGAPGDAWVVATAAEGRDAPAPRGARATGAARPAEGRGENASRMLRESVRWIGRSVDGRSTLEVGRWYAIALAEREARRALARRAA
jgi:hypothetical protein